MWLALSGCVHQVASIPLPQLARDEGGSQMRDDAMAELFLAQAEAAVPEGRIVLWAHNRHLATAPDLARCADVLFRPCRRWRLSGMGVTLRAEVGDAYRVLAIAAPSFEIWQHDGRSFRWRAPRGALERRVSPLPAFIPLQQPTPGIVGDVRAQLDEAFDAVVAIEGGRALLSLWDVQLLSRGSPVTWRSQDPSAAEVMARALRAEGWQEEEPAGLAGTWTRGDAQAELSSTEDGRWYVVTVRPVSRAP